MSSFEELSKIRFAKQYGSEKHQQRANDKISRIVDSDDTKSVHDIASSSDLDLTQEHINKIIEHKPKAGFQHPSKHLPRYHSGSLTDEHWSHLAKQPDGAMDVIAHAPLKHVKSMALNHPDEFVRQMATNQYVNRKRAGYPE